MYNIIILIMFLLAMPYNLIDILFFIEKIIILWGFVVLLFVFFILPFY